MAPPVFFIDPDVVPDAHGIVVLAGHEARHAGRVHRLRSGEAIHLVDGEGRRLEGVVRDVSRESVSAAVTRVVVEPEPQPRIVVVQALPKGDRGEDAVAAMTEVGVDVIVPWAAEHCVARWTQEKADRGVHRWRTSARAAAKQARRARVPRIEPVHSSVDLSHWIVDASVALCLDEEAVQPLGGVSVPDVGDVTLIVGPEGGLSDAERDLLTQMGAQRARLGPSILRTSTAGPVAAAVILARTPRWAAP